MALDIDALGLKLEEVVPTCGSGALGGRDEGGINKKVQGKPYFFKIGAA